VLLLGPLIAAAFVAVFWTNEFFGPADIHSLTGLRGVLNIPHVTRSQSSAKAVPALVLARRSSF